MRKKCLLWLTVVAMLISMLQVPATAESAGTVIFEGEATGKFTNWNQWKDALSLNLSRDGIDKALFTSSFSIEVEYEGAAAPVLFLMSWTGGAAKAQVEASSAENGVAVFAWRDMLRSYGDDFQHLNAITLRPNGEDVTIRKVTVLPISEEELTPVRFEGKAGDWLAAMQTGFNLGNTLESYSTWVGNHQPSEKYETAWGNPVTTREILQMIYDAGFDTIRIPTTWYPHMDDANNYAIDEEWMARVQEVVDTSLEIGLRVILNVQHDTGENGWLRADLSKMEAQTPKFIRLWQQIAERFRDYGDELVFEGFNEILDSDSNWNNPTAEACEAVNQLNQIFVDTVRATGGNNAERVLIVNPYAATHDEDALSNFVLPTDTVEGCLIVSFHMYTPINFCFPIPDGYTETEWENNGGKSAVNTVLNHVYTYLTSKGIPVLMGEFAASGKENAAQRCQWAAYAKEQAAMEGIPCLWWDNGGRISGTAADYRQMGLLDRYTLTWLYPDLVETITGVRPAAVHE